MKILDLVSEAPFKPSTANVDKLSAPKQASAGGPNAFQRGFNAVQPGGKLGPDAAQNWVKDKMTGANAGSTPKKSGDQAAMQATKGEKLKGGVSGQQIAKQLQVSNPQMLVQGISAAKQGKALTRQQMAAFSEAFTNLLKMDPAETQRAMMLIKRMESA